MRIVYSYLKEHTEVVSKTKPPVNPADNPLIDPRSVSWSFPLHRRPSHARPSRLFDAPSEFSPNFSKMLKLAFPLFTSWSFHD